MMAVTAESLQAARDYALSKMARRPDGALKPTVANGAIAAGRRGYMAQFRLPQCVAYADVQSDPKRLCTHGVCEGAGRQGCWWMQV